MRDADRLAVGRFLALNPAARKSVTVTELRCAHEACLLGAVVSVERRLYLWGVFDPTTTAGRLRYPTRTDTAWTLETLRDLTVGQFLQLWEAGAVRLADLKALAPSERYAVLYPLDHPRQVLRCRHMFGLLPEGVVPTRERKVLVRELEHVPPLREELE